MGNVSISDGKRSVILDSTQVRPYIDKDWISFLFADGTPTMKGKKIREYVFRNTYGHQIILNLQYPTMYLISGTGYTEARKTKIIEALQTVTDYLLKS
jgi:hypothetical protein